MALIQTSALIDHISGSVGSSNFYKSQHGQVLRRKANRKKSYSYEQNRTLSQWSRAIAYAKSVSAADYNNTVAPHAARMTYSKNGHTYTLSPFKYLVTLNFFRARFNLALALPTGQPRGRLDIPRWYIQTYAIHGDFDITFSAGVLPANVYGWGSCCTSLDGATPGKPQRFPHHSSCYPGTDPRIDFAPNVRIGVNTVYYYFRVIDMTGTWTPLIEGKHTWTRTS